MEKKNKKLVIIVSVLLVLVTGITFAYFSVRSKVLGVGSNTQGITANIAGSTVEVMGTLDFNDTNFLPGHQMVSALRVTATGLNELIAYNLIWDGINNLSTLNFTVYKSNSPSVNVTTTCTETNKLVGGRTAYFETCDLNTNGLTPINRGTIAKNAEQATTTLVQDEFITAMSGGKTVYYYVLLEYPNIDGPQNEEMGQGFEGKVNIVESSATPDINIIGAYVRKSDGTEELRTEIPNGYIVTSSECSENTTTVTGTTPNITINNLSVSGTNCTLHLAQGTTGSSLIADADSTTLTTSAQFGVLEPKSGATPAPGLYEFDGITSGSKTQFYRGNVTNNYVRLGKDSSNYTFWRIVRFDEDGNIRLIYDGTSAHDNGQQSDDRQLTTNYNGTSMITQKYYGSYNNAAYVGWTWASNQQWPNSTAGGYPSGGSPSDMKTYLEDTWLPAFKDKLSNKEKGQLTTGKYCNDRTLESGSWNTGSTMYFGARKRLETNKTPSFACDTRDTYTLEVGLLTADEYSFAGGGGYGSSYTNTSFYLYTGKNWWTMSPSYWDSSGYARVFFVHENGYLAYSNVTNTAIGVRPVITLKGDTLFDSAGDGTKTKPYTIS